MQTKKTIKHPSLKKNLPSASGKAHLQNRENPASSPGLSAMGVTLEEIISSLQGVALVVTDSKLQCHYANPFARWVLGLDYLKIKSGTARFPGAIKKRIQAEIGKSSSEFILQYALDGQVRTLKVSTSSLKNTAGTAGGHLFHMHDITNHVVTETALRNTESLLRSLINASPDFICLKDNKGRWLEANSSSLELFHLQPENYQYKTDAELAEMTYPALRDFFRHWGTSDKTSLDTGNALREEEIIPLPQGGEKILDIIKVPLYHEDGSPQGIVTLGRDVTARKVAEEQLHDRNAILDALISCDWMLHSSESWQKVAPRVLEIIGRAAHFSRATLLRNKTVNSEKTFHSERVCQWKSPDSTILGEDYKRIDYEADGCARWLGMLQKGDAIFGELRDFPPAERKYLKGHGSESILLIPVSAGDTWWGVIIIERSDTLLGNFTQELGAMMAIGRSFGVAIQKDTASKRLHQAKIAFESASEGIMITDNASHIVAINKGFTDITGYSEEEVLGRTPRILHSGRQDEQFYDEMRKTLQQNGRWRGEIWNKRKNGEIYPEWLTVTEVKDAKDQVINYVGVFADISEIKQSQNNLNKLVNHDPLTGLPNRRLFNELMAHAIKRAEREQNQIALLFIDLDRFKAINDSLGHQVGDKLLYEVSKRINHAVRESDAVARLGGDEFLVMMDLLRDTEDAAMVAKKVIHTLQSEFIIDGRELFIGASIGIAVYPQDGHDVDSLIKAADIAMYQVKNKGKNNYCFYSADLSKTVIERFTLENQLRRALERNQFEVYYQPQISLISGEIIGAESLVRWRHPELGMVSPAKFIPLAEETGLIIQIGEWVLKESALQVMRWVEEGHHLQWVSVNVSGVQIQRSNFADTLYGMLIETGCDPSLIELEITESTVMHNTEHVISVFDRIKHLGVRLAIDDFGTGYSSLSHLKRLPLDKLKIDQSFVSQLPDDTDDAAIANAINAMARSLGFSVIAEGVETVEQAEFLQHMGCTQAQGYLYGRPVPAADFRTLLADRQQKGAHDEN